MLCQTRVRAGPGIAGARARPVWMQEWSDARCVAGGRAPRGAPPRVPHAFGTTVSTSMVSRLPLSLVLHTGQSCSVDITLVLSTPSTSPK